MTAVVLFHGQAGLPGGFLGVSVFFTLSGYLITALLLAEHRHTGGVSLTRFYGRRVRRLLPASLACLAAVTLAGPWWSSTQRDHLPGDVWAALANVANWRFALAEHSYAELFRADPSPLAHYWSLAIEEQLYLLLPVLVVVTLRRRRRVLPAVTGGLVVASVALTVLTRDLDLAYHGTHARAAELLVGALLAQVGLTRRRWWASDLMGLAAGVGLVTAMATADTSSTWLYRGGFLLVALLSAALISAACHGNLVPRALAAKPLVALGRISYGVYLYHWPIFLLVTPARTGWSGWPLLAARSGITVAIATASFHWIEQPIRNGVGRGPRLVVPGLASIGAVALLAVVAVPTPTFTATERLLAAPADQPFEMRSESTAPRLSLTGAVRAAFTPPERPVVVVFGSDAGAAAALEGLDLQLVDATNPACPLTSGQAARTPTGVIDISRCAGTASEVAHLVEQFTPDVVVLAAGALDRAEVRLASQPDFAPVGGWAEIEARWLHVRDDLQAAVGAATAGGAAVVISDAGPPPGLDHDLFDDQLGRIGLDTPTPPTVARAGASLPMLVMAAAQSRAVALARTHPPRAVVVVIGDSTSLTLARALSDAAPDRLSVVWGGQEGCPIVGVEATRMRPSDDWQPSTCPPLAQYLPPLLDRYRPHMVLVAASLGELAEQRYPGDPAGHVAADPGYRTHHDRAMAALVELVGAAGAQVVVADTPAIRPGVFASPQMCSPARLRAWNAQIARWADQHDTVSVLGLAAVIEEYEASAGTIRTDGVHPEIEPLTELARQHLVDDLLRAWRAG